MRGQAYPQIPLDTDNSPNAESVVQVCGMFPYQVGVKAPGNPMMITFLPLVCSRTLIFLGSKSEKSSSSGVSCFNVILFLSLSELWKVEETNESINRAKNVQIRLVGLRFVELDDLRSENFLLQNLYCLKLHAEYDGR